ncbi:MAG TPA: O-methyltransferase [Ktedonobacterales bacterium]
MPASQDPTALREAAQLRDEIGQRLDALFAPEDDALKAANAATQAHGMPEIQISPLQGKLLQVLAACAGAKRILEIGALGGYSGIWLARALPAGGRLISLELSESHAAVAREAFARAGVADRAEVRVGAATETLPTLAGEAPFDLVFIDADKRGYPAYLDWALKLSRPGTLIIADNAIRSGSALRDDNTDPDLRGLYEYNQRIASDPRLVSVAIPMDDDGLDGFALSAVRE